MAARRARASGRSGASPVGANPRRALACAACLPPRSSEQASLYAETAAPIVDSVLEGFNGTIFAYGQTGTGKSHTMEGRESPEELRGVIPRAFGHIFDAITSVAHPSREFLVRASYLEIYNEEIRDLLAKNATQRLDLKESPDTGVYVRDLTSYVVKSVRECDKLREFGHKNRKTGETLMNKDSSRSHAIFCVTVEQSELAADGRAAIRMGKLNMVDLAGSERQSKTGATGERLKEATRINLSLSALGNCISALVDGKSSHIPYRDSKLTRMLQDSLGGNTKTVMIANLGPADYNYEESLSTLRYANRAKNIQNKPKINEDPKDAMLREFQDEIARLRDQLSAAGGGGGGGGSGPGRELVVEKVVEREVVVEKLVGVSHDEVERIRSELEAARAEERQALHDENLARREEALKAQAALLEQQEAMAAEARRVAETEAKLAELEAKLMRSDGTNILDEHARQAQELARAQAELQRREQAEADAARALAEQQESLLAREEKYGSLQEEADSKGRKLKKLYAKYKAAQAEVADLQAEFQAERADMLETVRSSRSEEGSRERAEGGGRALLPRRAADRSAAPRRLPALCASQVRELTRQLKLKAAVIDAFVPPEEQAKVEGRAEWDEVSGAAGGHGRAAVGGCAGRAPGPGRGTLRPLLGRVGGRGARIRAERGASFGRTAQIRRLTATRRAHRAAPVRAGERGVADCARRARGQRARARPAAGEQAQPAARHGAREDRGDHAAGQPALPLRERARPRARAVGALDAGLCGRDAQPSHQAGHRRRARRLGGALAAGRAEFALHAALLLRSRGRGPQGAQAQEGAQEAAALRRHRPAQGVRVTETAGCAAIARVTLPAVGLPTR